MKVQKKKGGILLNHLAFLVMLLLLGSYFCGAAVLVKSNTNFRCDGRLEECLIEEDLELEFLMNPYVSRILQPTGGHNSQNPNQPFSGPCGNPNDPQYSKCIADLKNGGNNQCKCKGIYGCRC
ncbi:hypothetical protein CJ030_MR2G008662 [Morella rubra]|uniref:Uncharacterized protein n=1 Tax=Morella rubra TaxID=262757 RepID=A0A6A1WAL2_9ROSI|nr:hypothetical protein CJ030_MR2G008662 [Morella rubra]